MTTLWWLLAGHALGDFALQSGEMARGKNRHRPIGNDLPPGVAPQVVWPYWLAAHGLIHGAIAALVTGSVWLGVAEAMCHGAIDFGKCENWYGIHTDQVAHLGCKLVWWGLA